jgi:hypothetical protein
MYCIDSRLPLAVTPPNFNQLRLSRSRFSSITPATIIDYILPLAICIFLNCHAVSASLQLIPIPDFDSSWFAAGATLPAMTITAVNNLMPVRVTVNPTEKRSEKPPPQLHSVQEWPCKGYQPPQPEGYQQSGPDSAIVIDNGKRIGMVCTGNY